MIRKTVGKVSEPGDPVHRLVRLRRDAVALYGPEAFSHEPRRTPLRKSFGPAEPRTR
jgi:hypothetical protein